MAGSHGNVHVISSKQEWERKVFEATTNGKTIVVDFTAAWCGPCKMIAPFYTELSEKYPQLVFLKVDVDELPIIENGNMSEVKVQFSAQRLVALDLKDVVKEWDIRAMPTFVFIKDGKQIDKLVGLNKPELERKVLNSASMSQSV